VDDVPDWLGQLCLDILRDDAGPTALPQQARADVFLRVNQRRGSVEAASKALAVEGIATLPHPTVLGCLRVTENPRRVKTAAAFVDGLVELQDASSQFAVNEVPVGPDARILDYCAGGGGKALAFADQYQASVFAHDIAPKRMADLANRAARAGVQIAQVATADLTKHAPFDVVFCDAPCSGSGTWRRTPDAKWRFTSARLTALQAMQAEVLDAAAPMVRAGGILAYATCSVLRDENDLAVERFFMRHTGWQIMERRQLLPDANGDGFYLCVIMRS
jgi:16S rRNA (cytosine967-C5)-methyltransferase